MSKRDELDVVDKKILNILLENAGTSYVEIAKRIHVSAGTVHVRMKRLLAMGVVRNSRLNVDYSQLGYDICAFLGIYLTTSSMYLDVILQLKKIKEIVSAHYTTGGHNIFIKIICKNAEHLRQILHDKIQTIEGIQRTETFISLEESINRSIQIPIEE